MYCKQIQQQQKQKKTTYYLVLNFCILAFSIFQIIGCIFRIQWLQMLKPMPIIFMLIYLQFHNVGKDHLVPRLVQLGLFFSLLGDILLMLEQNESFLVGTGFFLIAHLIYISAFMIGPSISVPPRYIGKYAILGHTIFIALFVNNAYMLWQVLPNRPFFLTYGTIITGLSISALNRYKLTNTKSFYFIFIGSVLFGLSDNILASLKFNSVQTSLGRAVIMLTYYSGQFLIMHGSLNHSNFQKQINQNNKNSNLSNFLSLS